MIGKYLLLLLLALLSACSSQPPRTLPPVSEGSSDAPAEWPERQVPAPHTPQVEGQAVVALRDQAEAYRRDGDSDAAAASLERALRIEPRNARLWQRLARVRLEQGEAVQAEQLALKSNALARTDYRLKAENWRIVAKARWARNDAQGARRAELKARQEEQR